MKRFILFIICLVSACVMRPQIATHNYILTRTLRDTTGTSYIENIGYYDGLGRPVQTFEKAVLGGSVKQRLTTLIEYDGAGRDSVHWLPVPSTAEFIGSNAFKLAAKGENGYSDSHPYTSFLYDGSMLPDRILEQYGPGSAWYNAARAVRTERTVNTETGELSCRLYTVTSDGALSGGGTNYSAGQLAVVKSTDEDGNISYTFTDKQGRLLLVRRMEGNNAHDTYSVYDIYDNLRFVLQPMYQTTADLDRYAFQYRYDGRSRCVWKKMPGAQHVIYEYGDTDRPAFSQDGNQRARGNGIRTYYTYDKFGRLTEQGECTGKEASSNKTMHIHNYYDTYDFIGTPGFTDIRFTTDTLGYGKGSLTGSVIASSDGGTKIYVAHYYDIRAREIKCVSNNLLGGYDVTSTTYTFTDKPSKVTHTHTASGKSTCREVYTYSYDHADRISKVEHTLGLTKVTLASYTYDNIGRLQSKSLHGSATNKLTYAYNVRSWLTGISGSKFTQNLYYNTGNGTARYNGNISSMTWKAGTESTVRGYKFTYDGLDRMLNATYGETAAININANRFSENVTGYDKNGNIKSLQRYGQTAASSYGLIDNLTFTLSGNQLTRVDDAVTTSAYNNGFEFKDAVKQANEYAYDANGNLTKDLNRNVTDIQYNFLNLPSKVTFGDGSTVTYTYAADGTKLRTVHKIGGMTTTTDYCGDVIYENGVQKLLLTEEGYVTLNDSKYHYYLQDHQGNNRVVINQSGTVEETNHYYPFGGMFASSSSVQPYKYNGKEYDNKKGLNWYDYGARHYDAALGRFMMVDPLTEKYYEVGAYVYCGDNPVRHIDPTGMFYTGFTMDEKGYLKKVNDEGGNEYDVIYNKSKYSDKTCKDYDTSGNKTGIKISKGIVNEMAGDSRNMSAIVQRGPIVDNEGYKIGEYANHAYEVQSDKESLALMNFLDKNVSVEWGNTLMKNGQGNTLNLLMTSHDESIIKMGSYQIGKYVRRGFHVIRADHIHPTAGANDPSPGDQGSAKNVLHHSPKAIFRILNQGKYYPYTQK